MNDLITCSNCGRARRVVRFNPKVAKTDHCKACACTLRNKARATHNLEKHPLYNMWANIKRRLANPVGKSRTYSGLDMDPDWGDIRNFVTWALSAGWEPGLSIERRDNAVGYWPGNCYFIKLAHQARNRSNNSVTQALADAIHSRVRAGENRYRVAKDVAAKEGIPLSTVSKVAYGYNWVGGQ